MASNLEQMQDKYGRGLIFTVLLLVHAALSQVAFAEEGQEAAKPFHWSAELVSFDQGTKMATLKARIDSHADVAILDELSDGDPVTVRWTGISWGAGISGVTRERPNEPSDALLMPAEFVRTEMDDTYLVFRVPVPDASVAKIEALEAGNWVTAMSPRDATELADAVTEMHAYNDVS
ncbi:MAG TPA: hypothetical protein VF329_00370 [Gammaproteobacteria bacterium]